MKAIDAPDMSPEKKDKWFSKTNLFERT
jgi:hypothetical protein